MTGQDDPLVRAQHVSRRYGDLLALDDVTLDVGPGELVGLLGPNGAGKTTLIDLVAGLRRPTTGTVTVAGGDPRRPRTRRSLGVTPQRTALPEAWRVAELAGFVAAHYPQPDGTADLLARFGLDGFRDRQLGGLSGGQQRRVAVALAFAGRPRVVLLDEPTTGLDVEARHAVWDGVRAFHADGGTVLLTSHYLDEVEALAGRVTVIDRGRIVADGDVAEITRRVGLRRVTLTCAEPPDLPGVAGVERDGDRTLLLTPDADRLVRDLVASGVAFRDLEIRAASLEEAFLALTGEGRR
jgi:ABC-2 type transport system ATP-binding protein